MRATARGRRTESAIIDAARQVFTEKGYFNTRIVDIARVAGKSTAAFYRYYDSKEALLSALIDEYAAELQGLMQAATHHEDPYKNIHAVVELWWMTYKKYVPVVIGVFHLSMTDAEFAQRWRDFRRVGTDAIAHGMSDAKRHGNIRGVKPDILASAIVSMVEGFSWVWLAAGGDDGIEPPDDDTAIDTLAMMWYRALYSPGDAVTAGAPRRSRATSQRKRSAG